MGLSLRRGGSTPLDWATMPLRGEHAGDSSPLCSPSSPSFMSVYEGCVVEGRENIQGFENDDPFKCNCSTLRHLSERGAKIVWVPTILFVLSDSKLLGYWVNLLNGQDIIELFARAHLQRLLIFNSFSALLPMLLYLFKKRQDQLRPTTPFNLLHWPIRHDVHTRRLWYHPIWRPFRNIRLYLHDTIRHPPVFV